MYLSADLYQELYVVPNLAINKEVWFELDQLSSTVPLL